MNEATMLEFLESQLQELNVKGVASAAHVNTQRYLLGQRAAIRTMMLKIQGWGRGKNER